MDDEFALCWNNFTDNITTGFQNLYDRGDLIDVTLACDGKLLHAHKIVLAICSPYFQEMFLTNPDKHPIIILKDVTFNVMCELLQFMYQGVVNVKQTELSSFMKIAQLLQIKGLTGSSNNNSNNSPKTTNLHPEHDHHHSQASGLSPLTTPTAGKSSSSNNHNNNNSHIDSPDTVAKSTVTHNNNSNNNNNNNNNNSASASASNNQSEFKNSHSSTTTTTTQSQQQSHHSHQQQQQLSRMHISENSSSSISSIGGIGGMNSSNLKRLNDFPTDSLSIYSRKQIKRAASELSEPVHHHNLNSNDSMDQINPDDSFLPPIPQITMGSSGGGASGGGCGSNSVNDTLGNNNNSTTGNGSNSNSDQRFNLVNVKREISDHHSSRSISPSGSNNTSAIRTQLPHFNFDYNLYAAAAANKNLEYPNDLHMPSDFSKSTANHMDIPAAGSAITMLSSTSLLHGSCIFNRNNTVATQQGMKTYWLCKSYRISMCRARCITHQGRVISSTGVHNHPPHMKNNEIINMSLFQFPPSQQSQQPQISTSQITQQHQVPGLQQNLQSTTTVLSATSLSNSATSLNQTAAALTLSNTNLNNPTLHGSGGSGNNGILSGNGNGISNNTNGLSGIINASGLGSNSNLHVQQLPSNFQNSTAAHLSHLNHLTAANNSSNNFNNSSLNMGISNSSTHQLQQQQQQHTMMQNVLSHQNSLMHLSSLPPSMLSVSNSIHQQSQQLQQEQLSPIHAHQQQPSHHSSLQHLQHQISQLSPSQLTSSSPTLHSQQHPSHHNHHHHHHNPHHHHQHHSSHHHNHHNSLGSNAQITSDLDNNDNNNNNNESPDLNSPHNIRRCDSSSGTHLHSQQIESPSIQQSTSLDSPTNQHHINGDLQSNTENNHHHHHQSSQSIIITNEPINDNEGSHQNNNDNEDDIDNDNCHNGDPDSNQSNMLATITMSPETHPTFKIEDM